MNQYPPSSSSDSLPPFLLSLLGSLSQMGHFHKVFILSSSVPQCPVVFLPLWQPSDWLIMHQSTFLPVNPSLPQRTQQRSCGLVQDEKKSFQCMCHVITMNGSVLHIHALSQGRAITLLLSKAWYNFNVRFPFLLLTSYSWNGQLLKLTKKYIFFHQKWPQKNMQTGVRQFSILDDTFQKIISLLFS